MLLLSVKVLKEMKLYIVSVLLIYYLVEGNAKCLKDRQDILPKRHLYFNGTSIPITLETSERPSHQLVTRLLRIFLVEVLGYAKVQVINGHNSMDALEIFNRLSDDDKTGLPAAMVNMEVWLPVGFNVEAFVGSKSLANGGPLGPYGRFGWFMPTSTVEAAWNQSKIAIDHWKSLKLSKVTSAFSLNSHLDLLKNVLTHLDPGNDLTYCNLGQHTCHDGIYYSSKSCHAHPTNCALLLVGNTNDYDNEILQHQIQHLELAVDVAWIGNHLDKFVRQMMANNVPVLFFNWVPNDITATRNFVRVLFPMCPSGGRKGADCDFEIHQLSKMMWSALKTRAPEAFDLITKIEFTQGELEELLRIYSRMSLENEDDLSSENFDKAACRWLHEHASNWQAWFPEKLSSKRPIYIGGLFPLSGPYWRQPGIVPGAMMAIEYINNNPEILADYELTLLIQDTQCKVDVAMTQFLQYAINKTNPIAGILGPGCSETAVPIAGVAKHFNLVIISYSADAVQLTNRPMFPLFFRTIPHILQNGMVYVEIFKLWKWENVALLAEDGQNFPEYHTFLKDLFLSRSIQVVYDRKIPRQASFEEASKFVDEFKCKEVNIIILTSFEPLARAVICAAYKKGMTASSGYVWFLPSWFTQFWWMTDRYNNMKYSEEMVPCSSEEMEEAVQAHFIFSTAIIGPDDAEIVGNCTVRQWVDDYQERMDNLGKDMSPYAGYAYDAVLVFALGLHQLLSRDPSALETLRNDDTIQKLMYFLNNTHFMGVSGPVQFSGADRTGIININQQIGSLYILIGQFSPDQANVLDRLFLNESLVTWLTPDGLRPSDGSPAPKTCTIERFRRLLGVDCDLAIFVANMIGLGVFAMIMVVGVIIVKKRYDAKVRRFQDRFSQYQDLTWFDLDKWEVPRNQVILNRKLGEGAFGTVYGGEALLDDVWVAVAVKTLKIGSSSEEKLDFLSEAELMKRFDHENIIRLLGVSTRGEPAYTIMEFMLHGDMKTFLLSRRQLVGQKTIEAEDVSALGLTRMAYNVALGLRYLADQKYVHRDLACRNCLVHAGKTVKIGDFGMTRRLYESDYYRFNRRGMFPVRWMAPESLTDGMFTTSSDVWSYGVLLYEIMTFGSFPYQGLSNREVLNFVKNGNRITLPKTCPFKLKELILSCWQYDPKSRPSVDLITMVLEQNNSLIIPCLDVPSTAVVHEGTESLEMNLLPRSKNRTSHNRISSEHSAPPPVRGVSMSSYEGDSKISGRDFSPDRKLSDPFILPAGSPIENLNRVESKTTKQQQSNSRSRLSQFETFIRSAKLNRSTSADDQARVKSPKSRRSDGSFTLFDANHVTGSNLNHYTSDVRSPLNQTVATLPSLESHSDSHYCSDHSKAFPSNVGCVRFF